jgi:hypothetical protein
MKISLPAPLVGNDREPRERLVLALIEGEESGLSDRTVPDIIAEAKSSFGDSPKPNLIA